MRPPRTRRLAFELAGAAMTAIDAEGLRAWAEKTERLAAQSGTNVAAAPSGAAAARGGAAAPAGARAARVDDAAPAGLRAARVGDAAPSHAPAVALRAACDVAHARPADLPAALVAAARVFAALADAWQGERVDATDLLAPLDALDDAVVGAHPTLLLHTSRALMRLERNAAAAALLKRAVAIGRGTSSGEMLVWLLGVQAWTAWLQLDLDAALAAAEAAEETARLQAAPNPLLLALSVRAAIHHDRGEPAEAERAAADCVALIAGLEPSETTHMAAGTLASLRVTDDPERCLDELDQVVLDPSWAGRLGLVRVRAALAAGRLDDADRFAREAAARAAVVTLPLAAIRAEAGTAEVLLAHGEPEAAARWPRRPRTPPTDSTRRRSGSSRAVRWRPRGRPRPRRPSSSASPPTPRAGVRDGCSARRRASCAPSAPGSPRTPGATRRPS